MKRINIDIEIELTIPTNNWCIPWKISAFIFTLTVVLFPQKRHPSQKPWIAMKFMHSSSISNCIVLKTKKNENIFKIKRFIHQHVRNMYGMVRVSVLKHYIRMYFVLAHNWTKPLIFHSKVFDTSKSFKPSYSGIGWRLMCCFFEFSVVIFLLDLIFRGTNNT